VSASTDSSVGSAGVRRRSIADAYRTGVAAAVVIAVAVLGLYWSLGDDPATATLDETEAMREELAPLRQVPLDDFIYLNDSSPHRWVLGPGFAPSEADGTWVRSRVASLVFYPIGISDDSDGSLEVELSLSPLLLGNEESRRVRVSSGVDAVEVHLPPQGARVVLQLPMGAEQEVEIHCDSLDVPAEDPGIADLRRLCVKVYAMAIRRVDGEGSAT